MIAAVLLAGCCIAMFGPIPAALARAHWPTTAPRAAVVLWQALGLAGGAAAIASGLAVAVAPLHVNIAGGVQLLVRQALEGHPLAGLGLNEALGLTVAADVAIVLCGGLVVTITRTLRRRSRHRHVLDLVSSERDEVPGATVLDHPQAVAYCVPGIRSRIVLSTGALHTLEPAEIKAVLAHERGHAHARHDLVMLPFASMADLLAWMPYTRLAPGAVAALLEMAADDFAGRSQGRPAVARALARLASSDAVMAPSCAFGAAQSIVVQRVERLLAEPPRARAAALAGILTSAGVLLTPFLLVAVPLTFR
jgi:Zn-dependent protease with chaperone function